MFSAEAALRRPLRKGGNQEMLARVSNKGQITLSAAARRKLGISPNSQVEVIVGEREITIRPLKRVSELAGVLKRYAKPWAGRQWQAVREQTEKAVAVEVAGANARWLRRGR
jgi:AbrB family looped-hinge helix DNA binding protein